MKKIDALFKRKSVATTATESDSHPEDHISKRGRTETVSPTNIDVSPSVEAEFDSSKVERDPGKRRQILDYVVLINPPGLIKN